MANEFNYLQWRIDTAADLTSERIRVQGFCWTPNAADDDLTILDKNDDVIWDADAADGGTAGELGKYFGDNGRDFEGINVSVIDGGTLKIYVM